MKFHNIIVEHLNNSELGHTVSYSAEPRYKRWSNSNSTFPWIAWRIVIRNNNNHWVLLAGDTDTLAKVKAVGLPGEWLQLNGADPDFFIKLDNYLVGTVWTSNA